MADTEMIAVGKGSKHSELQRALAWSAMEMSVHGFMQMVCFIAAPFNIDPKEWLLDFHFWSWDMSRAVDATTLNWDDAEDEDCSGIWEALGLTLIVGFFVCFFVCLVLCFFCLLCLIFLTFLFHFFGCCFFEGFCFAFLFCQAFQYKVLSVYIIWKPDFHTSMWNYQWALFFNESVDS